MIYNLMSKNLWEIPDHESAARSMALDRQSLNFQKEQWEIVKIIYW